MLRITRSMLRQAIAKSLCVDGSACVFDGGAVRLRPFLPPVVQAAFEMDEVSRESAATWLSVPQFEMLSLAARSHMLGHPCDGDLNLDRSRFPTVDPEDIVAVLAEVAARLAATEGRSAIGDAEELLASRTGLQLIGCRIARRKASDVPTDRLIAPNDAADGAARFVNARLPLSLRLIGCVIESPLSFTNCEIVTLDLSGSAVRGLDATSMNASGSIRLRRATILSPADFSGSTVRGVFDATDVVVIPLLRQPAGQAYSPERGVLNLTEATFQNDVYLNRARIWGGLRFTDAVMERSVFMNRAAVRSPIGVLERVAADLMPGHLEAWKPGAARGALQAARKFQAYRRLQGQSAKLATLLHSYRGEMKAACTTAENVWLPANHELKAGTAYQIVQGLTDNTPGMAPLQKLLTENMRARTTAVWADGATVKGRIFGRGLRAMGRVRMRYVNVGDGIHLEDSDLRSGVAIGLMLDALPLIAERTADRSVAEVLGDLDRIRMDTKAAAERRDYPADDEYVVDLREGKLGGSLEFGTYSPEFYFQADREANEGKPNPMRGRIEGKVALGRSNIRGSLRVARVLFRLPRRRADGPATDSDYAMDLHRAQIGGDLDFRACKGLHGVNVENADIRGSIDFYSPSSQDKAEGRPDEAESPDADAAPDAPDKGADAPPSALPFWAVSQGRRKGWRWIRGPLSLWLQAYALKTAKPRDEYEDQWRKTNRTRVEGRALHLRGDLMLRGCTIGGDARLVFNPRPGTGPSIKAELAKIGGRLDIMPYPHRHDEDSFLLDIDEFARNEKRAGEERVLIQKRSQYSPPSAWRALTTRSPHIDLRSAKAVAFCHPPPAWPRQGGLSLTGFKYGRTANIGPLAPHPYSIDYNEHGLPVSPLRRSNRDDLRLCLAIVFTSFLLVSSVLLVMPDSPVYRGSMLFSQEGAHGYMRQIDLVGRINLFLTFLVLSVCLWLEVLRNFAPRTDQSSPMALVYLKLQQVSRNRYRTPGTIYWALDPYVTATRALREEGRYLSAHAVEIDRLRQRYSMLSLRHHFLAKLLLGVVDRVSEYGFNISRTFVLLVLTLLAASMLAHASITVGALESKEAKPDSPVGLVNVVTGNARLDSVPTTAPPPPDVANEEFVSLLYAIDTVVPFLDFHQRDRWQAKIPKVHHLPNWAYLIWPDLFAAIGLFLTTIGVTSLATRMESVLARTED